jgi:pyruvate carboxylase
MLAELARDGLVTAETETVRAGHQPLKVTRVRTTDVERRALA